jgi:NTP pyrophosphatase (non-canonical NTP hydrolase)
MDLSFDDYQKKAAVFARYGKNPDYPFLALNEEAGELVGKLAKYCRNNQVGLTEAIISVRCNEDMQGVRSDLLNEIGDILWQIQQICTELDASLGDVAEANLRKLEGRKVRGTLLGVGDDR